MNVTKDTLLECEGATVALLADTLALSGRSLRAVDGRIEAVPPFTSVFGMEVLASVQPALLWAYRGARRDQPLEPAALFVCKAGCWTVIVNKRKASKCSICGVTRKDRKVELPWLDLPKKPRKAKKS